MPIIRLKTLVELQRKESAVSDFDYRGDRWEVIGLHWAQITPLNASTRAVANQVVADVTHSVIIRNPGYLPTHLQRFVGTDGVVFEIKSVRDVDGLGEYYECMCTVGA